jgi:hypothetical protein
MSARYVDGNKGKASAKTCRAVLQGAQHSAVHARRLLAEQDGETTAEHAYAAAPVHNEKKVLEGLAAAVAVWYNYTGAFFSEEEERESEEYH